MNKFRVILKIVLIILFVQGINLAQYKQEAKSPTKRMRIVKNPASIALEISFNKPVKDFTLKPGDINDFSLLVTNSGTGLAKSVAIKISSGDIDESIIKFSKSYQVGDVNPGEVKKISIPFTVTPDVPKAISSIFTFSVTETANEYELISKTLPIKILATQKAEIAEEETIELNSDVDKDIPISPYKNTNAVAVVITISKYENKDIPAVKFAKHDGKAVREYLIKTFGLSPENILPADENQKMSIGTLRSLIKQRLKDYLRKDGQSDLIVYFAGHGAPSTNNKKAYFVPYDGDPNFLSDESAYSMESFYEDLGSLKAKSKLVVIDACFSGSSGDGTVLVKDASSVLLDVDENTGSSLEDTTNAVFRSSTGQQVSNWYPENNHGLFTYYFLKGIQGAADVNKDGNITLGEIKNFINDENSGMPSMALRKYGRNQKAVISGKDDKVIVRLK